MGNPGHPMRSNQHITLQKFSIEESYGVVIATQQNMFSGFVPLQPLGIFWFLAGTSNSMDPAGPVRWGPN